jgi:hypothetical protein
MGGRLVPARMAIEPADKPGESTVLQYHELAFDVGLEPSYFSLQRLQRSER